MKVSRFVKTASRILIVALIINLFFAPTSVQAKSKKQAALKAYSDFLSKKKIDWGDGIKAPSATSQFALIYLDKNDIPELVVVNTQISHANGWCNTYTYNKGKLVRLPGGGDTVSYYEKKGVLVTEYPVGGAYDCYYNVSGSKAKLFLNYELRESPGYFRDTTYSKIVTSAKKTIWKKISKKEFQKLLKKKVGKTKRTEPKLYQNSAENRKMVLGY